MAGTDADALTCDMAEQYGVLNWRAHGARLAAVLAAGLRPHARVLALLQARTPPDAAFGFENGPDFDAAREKLLKAR